MSRVTVMFDTYFSQLCESLESGGTLLVSLDEQSRPNAMTIGWAQLGIIWGKVICTALVRPSRYTYDCCNATGDFTVNIPYASHADQVLFCGTRSGRDYDKFAECGFTALPAHSQGVASPWIKECGAVWECRTVAISDLLPEQLSAEVVDGAYPRGDFHRLYFGEVLACHADPDFLERFAKAY
jgi:flavin reductase (DIM6/NTAB) family NADH-FMN oxidoreductase RutF